MSSFDDSAASRHERMRQEAEAQAVRALQPKRDEFTRLARLLPEPCPSGGALALAVILAEPLRALNFAELLVGWYVPDEVRRWKKLIDLSRDFPPRSFLGYPQTPLPSIRGLDPHSGQPTEVYVDLTTVVVMRPAQTDGV